MMVRFCLTRPQSSLLSPINIQLSSFPASPASCDSKQRTDKRDDWGRVSLFAIKGRGEEELPKNSNNLHLISRHD